MLGSAALTICNGGCVVKQRTCPGKPDIKLTVHWIYAEEEEEQNHDNYTVVGFLAPSLSYSFAGLD